jgi:pyruvate dehydrogenase kinase 2/3/4
MTKFLIKEIFNYSNKIEKKIKLRTLLDYDFKKNTSFKLAFKEDLLTRLAKRTVEIENLPYGLSKMSSVNEISDWYLKSFEDLYNFNNFNNDDEMLEMLKNIYNRHVDTNDKMSEGFKQFNKNLSDRYNGHLPFGNFEKLNLALDEFYTNRLSVRLLIDQYINYDNPKENYVGIINKKTSPIQIINNAVVDARDLCRMNYGESPDIIIKEINNPTICYIPSHLYYVMFEIIKNSLQATVENNQDKVEIIISGTEDLMIKVSDRGKGIKYNDLEKIWYYSYTTSEYNDRIDLQRNRSMGGCGFGLPISRSLINFLDGDLTLMSMNGYGTDVYITIPLEA